MGVVGDTDGDGAVLEWVFGGGNVAVNAPFECDCVAG